MKGGVDDMERMDIVERAEGMEHRKVRADYRSYMERIVVDEGLHGRIMSRIAQATQAQGVKLLAAGQTWRVERTEPVQQESSIPRTSQMRKSAAGRFLSTCRLGVVLACAAAVVLVVRVVPQLVNPQSVNPPQTAVPPITLVFNRLEAYASPLEGDMSPSKRYIPGYFTQELSEDDVAALFGDAWPQLSEDYEVSAEAGFSGEGELQQVNVTCEGRDTGRIVSIVMAPGAVPMDVMLPKDAESTDVNGKAVMAGFWENPSDERPTLHFATFMLAETGYYIEVAGDGTVQDEIASFVAMIIESGAADLNKVTPDYIPEWREDDVTLAEALNDPDFGDYVPHGAPDGFSFESGRRVLNQRQDYLRVTWSSGMKYVTWTVRRMEQRDNARIVDVTAREAYDLSLYPIPRAESVPAELRETVDNPIVRAKYLTIDFIRARSYTVDDAGDDNTGYRMRFGVVYDEGEVLVELNAKGVTPEDVLEMFEGLGVVE